MSKITESVIELYTIEELERLDYQFLIPGGREEIIVSSY